MRYRLLALDLDGTVMDRDLHIPAAVRTAITAAQARGVFVTLATGRMYGATLPFVQELGIRDPVICYQGGLIRHPLTGEVYHRVEMPGGLAAEGVRLLLATGLFVIAYIDERLCIAERRAELDLYLQWHPEGAEVVVVDDLAALAEMRPPAKLLFIADPPVVERELAGLAEHFGDQLIALRSHALFGELTPPGISKGAALEALAQWLGVPRAEVMAIGDHENDLSMIRWAGLGLAMGNAIPSVRAAANAIIPTVWEGGVAWAIEHYLLSAS